MGGTSGWNVERVISGTCARLWPTEPQLDQASNRVRVILCYWFVSCIGLWWWLWGKHRLQVCTGCGVCQRECPLERRVGGFCAMTCSLTHGSVGMEASALGHFFIWYERICTVEMSYISLKPNSYMGASCF